MSTNSASVPMKEFITSIFVNIFFDTVMTKNSDQAKNKDKPHGRANSGCYNSLTSTFLNDLDFTFSNFALALRNFNPNLVYRNRIKDIQTRCHGVCCSPSQACAIFRGTTDMWFFFNAIVPMVAQSCHINMDMIMFW